MMKSANRNLHLRHCRNAFLCSCAFPRFPRSPRSLRSLRCLLGRALSTASLPSMYVRSLVLVYCLCVLAMHLSASEMCHRGVCTPEVPLILRLLLLSGWYSGLVPTYIC
ncbi:hypothetical protein F5X98DRAFT_341993, partial [Xylaria grammica]